MYETTSNAEQSLTPAEQQARDVCSAVLPQFAGYQGTFAFGMPGGNDLDLRLCFATMDGVPEAEIRQVFEQELRRRGVHDALDLLFMSAKEFEEGIRDLVELGPVENRLLDGFDPHEQQVAVGDTSMFSLYIFSTMRLLHQNTNALGSPQQALERVALTPEGAIGWMHFYTADFLREYLQHEPEALHHYQERLAKYFVRVTTGSTLAKLLEAQLATIKWALVGAIQAAGPGRSTDAMVAQLLTLEPMTSGLLDGESIDLLAHAGAVRNGTPAAVPPDFLARAEERLFLHAFDQGGHQREVGANIDPLTSYALGAALAGLGSLRTFRDGETLMEQGALDTSVFYVPLKTSKRQTNATAGISIVSTDGAEVARYHREPGRVVGEGALFGVSRSATVRAEGDLEAYVIDTAAITTLLADPTLHAHMRHSVLHAQSARRLDVFLRYLAREAAIFTRQTLPYTSLSSRQAARERLGANPLSLYNLGEAFHDTLQAYARSEGPVVNIQTVAASTLFEAGANTGQLFVVSEGCVQIGLPAACETVTLRRGEYFGESSLLGLPTTGTAMLTPGSRVLAVDAQWFKRFTQSREHQHIALPPELQHVLPVHLLYHLAAEGYDRVRRRLLTQRQQQ